MSEQNTLKEAFAKLLVGVTFLIFGFPTLSQTQSQNSTNSSTPTHATTGHSVNELGGSFAFSIPVVSLANPEGDPYVISLNYAPPAFDQEASWVGLGWSLNPGSIVRSVSGIPDDYNNDTIVNISKSPANRVHRSRAIGDVEALSASLSGARGSVWNSDLGFSRSKLQSKGIGIAGMSSQYANNEFGIGGSFTKSRSATMAVWSAISMATTAALSFTAKGKSFLSDSRVFKHYLKHGVMTLGTNTAATIDSRIKNGNGPKKWHYSERVSNPMPLYQNDVDIDIEGFSIAAAYTAIPLVGAEIGLEGEYIVSKTKPTKEVPTYGFIYSSLRDPDDETSAMDFTEDTPHSLDRYDKFIPMPVPTQDVFAVNAMGLSGSFKAELNQPGHFYSTHSEVNKNTSFFNGLEVTGGYLPWIPTPAGTFNVGLGATASINNWDNRATDPIEFEDSDGNPIRFANATVRPYFRFTNDATSTRIYFDDFEAPEATGSLAHPIFEGDLSNNFRPYDKPTLREAIRFNTVQERLTTSPDSYIPGVGVKTFDRSPEINTHIDWNTLPNSSIAEFQVLDQQGKKYNFGLPVYGRDRFDLSFSTYGNDTPDFDGSSFISEQRIANYNPVNIDNLVDKGFSENSVKNESARILQGSYLPKPYAHEYLITSITSPNYIDQTMDGPSPDDIGGWIKFNYTRLQGSTDKTDKTSDWFKYRAPFHGCFYRVGALADPRDDLGSISGGEKEQYVIHEITTPSHTAVFHSGSRDDAHSPGSFNAPTSSLSSNPQSKRLDKIEVFSNKPGNDLLYTVWFTYDYTLRPGCPSSSSNQGELTLTRVHLTYANSTQEENIYDFGYEYPSMSDLLDGKVTSPLYNTSLAENVDDYSEIDATSQNPPYASSYSSNWGNQSGYLKNSVMDNHNTWDIPEQALSPDYDNVDPAAYALKEITLPNGLSILPQYERGSYSSCAESPALVMKTLSELTTPLVGAIQFKVSLSQFYDNNFTAESRDLCSEYYSNFFELNPDLYASLAVKVISQNATFNAEDDKHVFDLFLKTEDVSVSNSGDMTITATIPDEWSMYTLVSEWQHANPGVCNRFYPEDFGDRNKIDRAWDILWWHKAQSDYYDFPLNAPIAGMSSIRIPLPPGKAKPASTRIKRLLFLDEGVAQEADDERIFGSEYRYEKWDENIGAFVCSGVASNEPSQSNAENPRYRPFPRRPLTAYDDVVAGDDIERLAGILGSSYLPAPKVLYSETSVIPLSVNEKHSSWTTSRHFTHREYPVEISFSSPARTQWKMVDKQETTLFFHHSQWQLGYAQGFQVLISDFAGKPKESFVYSGFYDNPASWSPTSGTTYTYHNYRTTPSGIQVMDNWSTYESPMGRWDELYMHGKSIISESLTTSLEADVSAVVAAPLAFPLPTGNRSKTLYEEEQSTLAATRVTSLPAILKSTTSFDGTRRFTSWNEAHSPITGIPIVTRTTDATTYTSEAPSFKYNISLPSAEIHEELGNASSNDRAYGVTDFGEYEGFQINLAFVPTKQGQAIHITPLENSSLCDNTLSNGSLCDAFYPGDLIRISALTAPETAHYYTVDRVRGNIATLTPSDNFSHGVTSGSACSVSFEVIQSGRKNMMNSTSESIDFRSDELEWDILNTETAGITNLVNTLNTYVPSSVTSSTSNSVTLPSGISFSEDDCASSSMLIKFEPPNCGQGWSQGIGYIKDGPAHIADPDHFGTIGQFDFDESKGALIWTTPDAPCCPTIVGHICETANDFAIQLPNGINDVANVVSDDLDYELAESDLRSVPAANPYERGTKGRWASLNNAIYKDESTNIFTHPDEPTTQLGVKPSFSPFHHGKFVAHQSKWTATETAHKFDGDGFSIQTTNPLGEQNARQFSRLLHEPSWSIRNGAADEAFFQSFEDYLDLGSWYLIEGGVFDIALTSTSEISASFGHNDDNAHTGNYSYSIAGNACKSVVVAKFKPGAASISSGYRIRFWATQPVNAGKVKLDLGSVFFIALKSTTEDPIPTMNGGACTGSDPFACNVMAQTGEWTLLECIIPPEKIPSSTVEVHLQIDFTANNTEGNPPPSSPIGPGTELGPSIKSVRIDDIRGQPVQSAMHCFVNHHDEGKPLAIFGEDHFPSINQYSPLGEPIRVVAESERGRNAKSETFPHKKIRNAE